MQLFTYISYPASLHCNIIDCIFIIFASSSLSHKLPQTILVASGLVRLLVPLGWDLFFHTASLDAYHPLLNHNINNICRYVCLCAMKKQAILSALWAETCNFCAV